MLPEKLDGQVLSDLISIDFEYKAKSEVNRSNITFCIDPVTIDEEIKVDPLGETFK